MNRLNRSRFEKWVFFLLLLYAATVWMFDGDGSRIRLIYLSYGLLCLGILFYNLRVKIWKETFILIGYVLFGFLSIIWAVNMNTAMTRSRGVLLILVGFLLLYSYVKETRKPQIIIYAIIVGTTALSFYIFYKYGVANVFSAISEGNERLGSDINNVNWIANSLNIGIIAIIGVALFYRKYWLLLLLLPIGVVFLGAGSRMATLSVVAGVLGIIILYIRFRKKTSSKIIYFFIALLVLVLVWSFLKTIPALQTIILRIENTIYFFGGKELVYRENSTQMRMDYIELGWQQFLKTPIFGNGIGCAGYALYEKYGYITYLHNNFIEILASGGIVGFILFYTPYFVSLVVLINRIFKKQDNDPIAMIAFVLLIMRLIGHMGIVVYYSKIEYLLFVLWISVSNIKVNKNEESRLQNKKIESITF